VKVFFHHLEVTALDKDFHLGLKVLLATSFEVVDLVSYLNYTLGTLREILASRFHLFYIDLSNA